MATATKPRQATRHSAGTVKGSYTLETLSNGKFEVVETRTYESSFGRSVQDGFAEAWCNSHANSRVVEHFFENGKGRHMTRYGLPDLPAPEPWNEVDCALEAEQRHYSQLAPQHVQGVDYW